MHICAFYITYFIYTESYRILQNVNALVLQKINKLKVSNFSHYSVQVVNTLNTTIERLFLLSFTTK